MKKVLIVSPHFPPVNAADMHRVRQSLPYFEQFGWKPTVLCVDPEYVEMAKDDLLAKSLPTDVEYIMVKAYSTKYTRKLGLGNLGLRAFIQLLKAGNTLLKNENFDLIYFSTTVFASMPLGRIWKRKFNIPFILDLQDPWRNDYYLTVPKEEKPPKFWFAYNLDKYLERFTVPKADGLIAVSQSYIDELKLRYPEIDNIPEKTLTFGAHPIDIEIATNIDDTEKSYFLDPSRLNIIYAGAVPNNMLFCIEAIFKAIKRGVEEDDLRFKQIQFHFLGTNYAIGSAATNKLTDLIEKYELDEYVTERAIRLPYFEVLQLIKKSDLAILPGTLDQNYTASKLYPYILSKIPMIAVFHESSSVVNILKELNYGAIISFNSEANMEELTQKIHKNLYDVLSKNKYLKTEVSPEFDKYLSKHMTLQQSEFFDLVLNII